MYTDIQIYFIYFFLLIIRINNLVLVQHDLTSTKNKVFVS